MRFISKTTGTEGGDPEYLDSDISVNIEKLKGDDKYRVTIERYNIKKFMKVVYLLLDRKDLIL